MKKYILLLFWGITFTLSAQDINIIVPIATQEQSNWCGIAASQCVLSYFGPYVQQCAIMEYVRKETLSYGIANCCVDVNQGCNAGGIDLYGGKGTVQAILSYFGTINSIAYPAYPWISEIIAYLRSDRPLIVSLENKYNYAQHAVVVHGIRTTDYEIYYMDPSNDPQFGGYRHRSYTEFMTGFEYGMCWFNTLVLGDELYPAHCYNCILDGDETDIDCGGSCEPCYSLPPPPTNCTNCLWEFGEAIIEGHSVPDCGGSCPSCYDLTEEVIIENRLFSNSYYHFEHRAAKKITAKGATSIESGTKVSFITSDTGSIVLLPDFRATRGSNFSAYTKDLSEYSRICPDTLCATVSSNMVYGPAFGKRLELYDLLYAVKIEYEIYDLQGQFIYGDTLKITRNGSFTLWSRPPQGEYWLFCTIHYCNGMKSYLMQRFVVMDYPHKSLTEKSEEPEAPPQFSPSNPNNTSLQSATAPPHFSIIPNPNSGTFQLETNFPFSDIANLKVANFLGATVYETQNVAEHTIQLQSSASGMFFVVVMLKDGNVLTQKMMIQ